MREFHVAMAFLRQVDKYHFQKRVGPYISGALGKIGCFGGQIEDDETFNEAVSREVKEETGLLFLPNQFHYWGQVNVISDRDNARIKTKAEVFDILLPPDTQIEALHGELVTVSVDDLKKDKQLNKFTPATRAAVESFF